MGSITKVLVKVSERIREIKAFDPLTQDSTLEIIKIIKELIL